MTIDELRNILSVSYPKIKRGRIVFLVDEKFSHPTGPGAPIQGWLLPMRSGDADGNSVYKPVIFLNSGRRFGGLKPVFYFSEAQEEWFPFDPDLFITEE